MAQQFAKWVVGIDFGTTFSGFTYARVGGNGEVFEAWNYPGSATHLKYPKVPTALLYDGVPLRPKYWGWEAEDHKHENPKGFTKLFKLCLAPKKMHHEPYPTPEGITQHQCIVDFLRLMKEFILDTLQCKDDSPREKILHETQFCLTVPAIWEQFGREQMRKAAEMAGLVTGRHNPGSGSALKVQIVLEPEAASMFCARDGNFQSVMREGDPYLVLDIGGGTTDIAVHSFGQYAAGTAERYLKEVVAGSGALVGGSFVDAAFVGLLEDKIPNILAGFADVPESRAAFNKFMSNWDDVKRSFTGDEDVINVELPGPLKKFWYSQNQEKFEAEGMEARDIEFSLSNAEMREMFDDVIDAIQGLTLQQHKVVISKGHPPPRVLTLVGGLSESPYINRNLHQILQGHFAVIHTPVAAGSAVAKGATVYGLGLGLPAPRDPADLIQPMQQMQFQPQQQRIMFQQRIARRTYVVDTVHGPYTWVHTGDQVPIDSFQVQYFEPAGAQQNEVIYEVYSSEAPEIQNVKAQGVRLELSIHIPLPVTNNKRMIETKVYFGGEVITISAKNSITDIPIDEFQLDFRQLED